MQFASTTVGQIEHRALGLLLSLVLYMVLIPTVGIYPFGALILIASLYAILVTAILQVAAHKGTKAWLGASILSALSMAFIVLSHVKPIRPFVVANQALLIVFFTMVITRLFKALGRPGAVTKSRLYTSVSVYLILAMLWAVVYAMVETLHPGSFSLTVGHRTDPIPGSFILYMSVVSLTGLGTGDLVPASQLTRMLVGMESVNGVLYVAVTIARLVSAYHSSAHTPD